jgi:hypothetical protein
MVSYNRQFKRGYFPDQPADESTRVNGHDPDSPSKQRKRNSVSLGSQVQANPGMVGKQSFGTKNTLKGRRSK